MQLEKRFKWATFPFLSKVDEYNVREQKFLSSNQLNQLKDLTWIEQQYNIIFLEPPDVGKAHPSISLGKVVFTTMGDLIQVLKTEEITRKSKARMTRIREADLVIIDDLMFMAMDKQGLNMFFHLINNLYNQSFIILMSNKGPKEWDGLLGDQAITTAILNWILQRGEIIHLNEDSWRMKHRKTIFGEQSVLN